MPAAVRAAGVDPAQVIGIGTDFTACTVLPVLADGTPLCELPEFADRPHAYVKLWKHHAAQAHADRINELAHRRGEPWITPLRRADLQRVGVRQGTPAAGGGPRDLRPHGPLRRGGRLDRLAARRAATSATPARAGYKGIYQDGQYPDRDFLAALNPDFAGFAEEKVAHEIGQLGDAAGRLTAAGRGSGPGCPAASRSRSATSTRTSPPPPPRPSSPARWSRSWARRPAT